MKPAKTRLINIVILCLLFLPQILFLNNALTARADDSLWNLANEGGLNEIGQEAYGTNKPRDIRIITANIIKVFLGLLGIIFLALIITAGYKWMTSGGNEEKIKEAQQQIVRAAVGLIIILAAYAITDFATDDLRRAITGEVW